MIDVFTLPKKPHAVIFNFTTLTDVDTYIKKYMKAVIDDPTYDVKIDNLTYVDLVWFENKMTDVNKENINLIIKKFSSTAFEKTNKKFYVIKNIEKCSDSVVNSLLKFLEEPYDDIYAIFTTANSPSVLPTISSRCQIFNVATSSIDTERLIITLPLDYFQKKYACKVYHDFNMLKADVGVYIYQSCFTFSKTIYDNTSSLAIYKKSLDEFLTKTKYELDLIIKILYCFSDKSALIPILDILHTNPNKPLLFDKLVQIIKH